ncbi:MAG: hypothetical protein Q605_AUC00796G0003 [Actinomyces urogenitalis DORA_12]|uniref:Uncharacterized protein n=1 Tax=Actinomyces urogenitalis DORA_12 TaxID=1403939 RepID=W1VCJ5_9ACTO|nr:MAG: hypothetical protein Q605_AUC00796G0003 [Actinomyces urogenitalis DORA_12]
MTMSDRDEELARLTKEQRARLFEAPPFRNPFHDSIYLQRDLFKPILGPLFGTHDRDKTSQENTK